MRRVLIWTFLNIYVVYLLRIQCLKSLNLLLGDFFSLSLSFLISLLLLRGSLNVTFIMTVSFMWSLGHESTTDTTDFLFIACLYLFTAEDKAYMHFQNSLVRWAQLGMTLKLHRSLAFADATMTQLVPNNGWAPQSLVGKPSVQRCKISIRWCCRV